MVVKPGEVSPLLKEHPVYGKIDIKSDVVICDIDGTISNLDHRLHYVKGKKKDFDSFFHFMDTDKLRQDVYSTLLEAEDRGNTIIFVSARPENYRHVTEVWLKENVKLRSPLIVLLRPIRDTRPDTEVKKEIYEKYLSTLAIRYVIDDRPKVLRMWRELGLDTVDVGSGVEF